MCGPLKNAVQCLWGERDSAEVRKRAPGRRRVGSLRRRLQLRPPPLLSTTLLEAFAGPQAVTSRVRDAPHVGCKCHVAFRPAHMCWHMVV